MTSGKAPISNTTSEKIVIYDGICNLCNALVRRILKHHPDPPFDLVSSYSEQGEELLKSHSQNPLQLTSVVDLKHGILYTKSDAVIEIGKDLKGGWRWMVWLKWLPRWIRDLGYMAIAKSRYRIFGRQTSCPWSVNTEPDK